MTVKGDREDFESMYQAMQHCAAYITAYYLILVAYTRQLSSGISMVTCSQRVCLHHILNEEQMLFYLFCVRIAHGQDMHTFRKQKNVTSPAWQLMVNVSAPSSSAAAEVVNVEITLQQLIALGIVHQPAANVNMFNFCDVAVEWDFNLSDSALVTRTPQAVAGLNALRGFRLRRAGQHAFIMFSSQSPDGADADQGNGGNAGAAQGNGHAFLEASQMSESLRASMRLNLIVDDAVAG